MKLKRCEQGERAAEGATTLLCFYFVTLVIPLEWEGVLGIYMSWPQAAEYKMITNK
jgi:hypothetical protein